ncbi:hypothetical protein [Brevundimonas sp.]|uniref:hypothetical protein n=1 Tax=Brevundimonas sp. TaxID=1871086 RepID=UPI0012291345|nr:hypothetical protein [Brevundimonas sp.]TAJ62673.1 MAG: hypothetical protein EPO49_08275 [Brevundimonas sp.]
MTDEQRLALVRGLHTVVYVVMAASVFVLLYAGVSGARGTWLWWALGLITVEIVVFLGNGMRCPMTAMVTRLGKAGSGISDTFFPEKITRHTLRVFGPLIVLAFSLLAVRWLGWL